MPGKLEDDAERRDSSEHQLHQHAAAPGVEISQKWGFGREDQTNEEQSVHNHDGDPWEVDTSTMVAPHLKSNRNRYATSACAADASLTPVSLQSGPGRAAITSTV